MVVVNLGTALKKNKELYLEVALKLYHYNYGNSKDIIILNYLLKETEKKELK